MAATSWGLAGRDRLRMNAPWVGRPLRRFEDARLVIGRGRYADDMAEAGSAWAVFVRSPHAHAVIERIDISGVRGALAVLTAADYQADGHQAVRHVPNPADAHDVTKPTFGTRGALVRDSLMWPLAVDRVRFVGEPVAIVVAATQALARDAAEAVVVDYAPLDAVVTAEAALAAGAPVIWEAFGDNRAIDEHFGAPDEVEEILASAAQVTRGRFVNQRIVNAQMEPRALQGSFDPASGIFTLRTGSQGVVRQKAVLAQALGVPVERVRVLTGDVGGGFGPRSFLESEAVLAVWAARRVGCPVRWRADRSECFLTDFQARDLVTEATLAFDPDGRILAMQVRLIGNVGAHSVAYVPLANGSRLVSTVYHVPMAHVHVVGAFTNTPSTVAFRGAGRPEATFAIERLLDLAAPKLGLDRVELRRRNMVPRGAMPYRNAMGLIYDCGAFAANMDLAMAQADYAGFPARRAASEARGLRRGISVNSYVESPVGAPRERVEVTVLPEGMVEVVAGTQSTGQGHETSFAQVVADMLGVTPAQVRLVTGDTTRVAVGGGTHSDRSMRLAGTLLVRAGGEIAARAKVLAAELLGIGVDDVVVQDGRFGRPGSNESFGLFDISRAVPDERLAAVAEFNGRIPAFPTGCAVCEVEVDPETGVVSVVRYGSVDDAGQPINPMIVEGQTHGSIVQGLGQALYEEMRWDVASGQVLTGSFMDYAMPRADMFPAFEVSLSEDPTELNPLRVKGGGEGGIVPALAAVIGAITDALAADGIVHLDLPATPLKVWQALHDAAQRI